MFMHFSMHACGVGDFFVRRIQVLARASNLRAVKGGLAQVPALMHAHVPALAGPVVAVATLVRLGTRVHTLMHAHLTRARHERGGGEGGAHTNLDSRPVFRGCGKYSRARREKQRHSRRVS
jgi:hypothetical protein